MLGRPRCPNCGHGLLVVRVPAVASGRLRRPTDDSYRCYRCFTKFTPDAEPSDGGLQRDVPRSTRRPTEDPPTAKIVDTSLVLEERGTKSAVEEFAVTVQNLTDGPIEVTQIRLTFDGREERTAPKDDVVIPPEGRETIDVRWSWIHPDQHEVTVEVRSDGRTLAATSRTLTESR